MDPISGLPPVFINHSYGILSQKTIDALQNDPYLKDEFIGVNVSTINNGSQVYTGTYLTGRDTYLELFPEGFSGLGLGVTGLGLGDEQAGGIDALDVAWLKAFGQGKTTGVTDKTSVDGTGKARPWFKELDPVWTADSKSMSLWDMEYDPSQEGGPVPKRVEYNAPKYQSDKIAKDVSSLVYGLEDSDRELLRESLSAAGMTIEDRGADGFIARTGNDNGVHRAIIVEPATEGRKGLLGVFFELNKPAADHVEPLGDALLRVHASGSLPYGALWFVPPPSLADEALLSQEAKKS